MLVQHISACSLGLFISRRHTYSVKFSRCWAHVEQRCSTFISCDDDEVAIACQLNVCIYRSSTGTSWELCWCKSYKCTSYVTISFCALSNRADDVSWTSSGEGLITQTCAGRCDIGWSKSSVAGGHWSSNGCCIIFIFIHRKVAKQTA